MPLWAISALPGLRALAPGEGALLVAEELVLEEVLGDGRAVDGHEGPLGPGRELVEGAAHQLLARAALPEQEHGGLAGGGPLDGEHGLLEGGVLADHPGQAEAPLVVLLQEEQLGLGATPLHGPVEQQQEVVGVHGLGEEVGGAFLHGAHRLFHGAEGGHHDDRHSGVGLLGRLEDVEAAARGQAQVGEDRPGTRRPGCAARAS